MSVSEVRQSLSLGLDARALSLVTLGVVTYNSAEAIGRLLQELGSLTDVIVADNYSRDATLEEVRAVAPNALVLAGQVNAGFAKAANRIIRGAWTKYVLLVNPDCCLPVPCILELVRVAELHSDAAIIAPILRFEDGRLQRSFLPFDPTVTTLRDVGGEVPVRHVIGAVMLLRREVIVGLGGFDEEFFLYGEDEDLCVRVLQAGHKIVIATRAEAVHRYGASTKGVAALDDLKAWHLGWSRARFALKSKGAFGLVVRVGKTMCRFLIEAVISPRRRDSGRLSQSWQSVRGTIAFVLGRDALTRARIDRL